jgi:signal transduction histidine kinase
MKLANISPNPAQASATRLPRFWLIPARLFWLAATAIAISLFIAGLPARANEIDLTYRGDIQASLLQNGKGQVVFSTWPGFAAARAGVLEGDILLAVDAVQVTSAEQAASLLAGAIGTPVTVSVRTGNFPVRQLTITRSSVQGEILLRYGLSSRFAVIFVLTSEILLTIVCLLVALVIFWYRSDDWMALFAALILTMSLVGLSLPVISFKQNTSSFLAPWVDAWFSLAFGLLLVFFYLFPGGKFVPRVTMILSGGLVLWTSLGLIDNSWYPWNLPRVEFAVVVAAWVLSGTLALVYRYFYNSDSSQRQQIRWIVLGVTASAASLFLQIIPLEFGLAGSTGVLYDFGLYPLGQLFKLLLPFSISFAVLRYRLWDIHIIVNRSLVYATLTASLITLYILSVGGLSALFQTQNNLMISFSATGFIAVIVQPLHQRLQRGINRLMYGERDDPYAVLTRLSGALETTPAVQEILPTLTETIGHTLKIPYVAILLDQNGMEHLAAEYGTPATDTLSFPLLYQGESIGSLQLARRAPQEEFSRADQGLIENIARQAGAAAQAVRLNAELIRSRTQIVNEREEERLRIRRDLHDELGPILASQGLKMAAARQLIRSNPEKALGLLDDIMQQSQQTVTDIRRLVHGLRPPALDQLGLVDAIRDLARHSDDLSDNSLTIDFSTPGGSLPGLPPAVEVNAYRIVLEAISNVTRHARARQCMVTFEIEQNALVIQISDDGAGLPKEYRAGVGLRSMRERAEEIGGRLIIEPVQPHGTQVTVWLPLSL